jgi:hypothetical protein
VRSGANFGSTERHGAFPWIVAQQEQPIILAKPSPALRKEAVAVQPEMNLLV